MENLWSMTGKQEGGIDTTYFEVHIMSKEWGGRRGAMVCCNIE